MSFSNPGTRTHVISLWKKLNAIAHRLIYCTGTKEFKINFSSQDYGCFIFVVTMTMKT